MKFLNIILVIIAILLAFIGLRLFELHSLLSNQNESAQQIVNSQQAVISSNQKLELSLNDLRKQINDIGDKLTRK